VAKRAVWLYGQVDDDLAEQILQQIGGIQISDTSIWRQAQHWGSRLQAHLEAQAAVASSLPQHGEVIRGTVPSTQRMGVAMDGAQVNIRHEGWKELKVGCVFDVAVRSEEDPETHECADQAHAVHNSYVAHLGGPEAFGQKIWAEAVQREFPRAPDTIALGDGAPWIWGLVGEHFGTSWQVVDWYHAKEHLYKASTLTFGDGNGDGIRWAKGMEKPLYQGQAWQVADGLKRLAEEHPSVSKVLNTEAGYFAGNVNRMQYLELREEHWPIGSGMVESACKQFRARFDGPGMRWSRSGAEHLIPVRAVILGQCFDPVWASVHGSPQG
jgi:hypothetical protein